MERIEAAISSSKGRAGGALNVGDGLILVHVGRVVDIRLPCDALVNFFKKTHVTEGLIRWLLVVGSTVKE